MITITGGKLTTWRRMAKMTVDRIVERDVLDAPCRTHEIPLGAPVDADSLPRVAGLALEAYEALAARYGHAATAVLALAAGEPRLARPIVAGFPDLLAEAVQAVRAEQARSIADVLFRRTRLGAPGGRRARRDGPPLRELAAVLGDELGWDGARARPRSSASLRRPRRRGLAERAGERASGRHERAAASAGRATSSASGLG